MKYIIVFYALFSSLSLAQNTPSFDENASREDVEEKQTTKVALPAGDLEANRNGADSTSAAVDSDSPPLPKASQGTSTPPAPGGGEFPVYRPSEEISEDLSVPFPTDI